MSWLKFHKNNTDEIQAKTKLLQAINMLPNVPIKEPKNKIVKNEIRGKISTIENISICESKLQGVEPRAFGLTDQRSTAELQLLSPVRIELTTTRLSSECSTSELWTQITGLCRSWTDNLARAKRMLCQLELTAQMPQIGIEPTTGRFSIYYSTTELLRH